MNRQDYLLLQAERQFLSERLATLPEKAWITTRVPSPDYAPLKRNWRKPKLTNANPPGRA